MCSRNSHIFRNSHLIAWRFDMWQFDTMRQFAQLRIRHELFLVFWFSFYFSFFSRFLILVLFLVFLSFSRVAFFSSSILIFISSFLILVLFLVFLSFSDSRFISLAVANYYFVVAIQFSSSILIFISSLIFSCSRNFSCVLLIFMSRIVILFSCFHISYSYYNFTSLNVILF